MDIHRLVSSTGLPRMVDKVLQDSHCAHLLNLANGPGQIMNINESPVFLLLDTDMSRKHKDLPVSLYESGAPMRIVICHLLCHDNAILFADACCGCPQSCMRWMARPRQCLCSPNTLCR